jgi:hypothetical protein
VLIHELTWLAGLLEGEGSFSIKKHKPTRYSPKIQVRMTDRDTIERASKLMGGRRTIHTEPAKDNRSECYRVQISGQPAASLMEDLFPHMGERRQRRINEILDWWSHGGEPSSAPLSSS